MGVIKQMFWQVAPLWLLGRVVLAEQVVALRGELERVKAVGKIFVDGYMVMRERGKKMHRRAQRAESALIRGDTPTRRMMEVHQENARRMGASLSEAIVFLEKAYPLIADKDPQLAELMRAAYYGIERGYQEEKFSSGKK